MKERKWIDIEPGKHSLSAYEISKKVIHLLRHSQQVHREEDGAVHFWRIKEDLPNYFPQSIHWFDDRWKVCLAAGGGAKMIFQYCTDDSGIIIYFRALQGHEGRKLLVLHCRTMLWFRADSSKIFTILDVDSIFILSSTLNQYLEVRIRARDRQYSFCALILGTKVTRILRRLT